MHKPEFKAKVALEAIKGEMTMARMIGKFDVQQVQITKGYQYHSDAAATGERSQQERG